MNTPRILIIAGSDSGGGAGIQADIKTVTMLGGHAMTAITAITAQNTLGVQAVMPVPTEMVLAQIDSCASDIGVDAVKIGMIGSAEIARAVADRLEGLAVPAVFDPVMVATSGSVLADDATIAAFARLMQVATVVTPNLPELEALAATLTAVRAEPGQPGCQMAAHFQTNILVKGGHAEGADVTDVLYSPAGEIARWTAPRIDTTSTHGTGCTLASAVASGLAAGLALPAAVARARDFVRLALHDAPGLGEGHGPMGHQSVRLDLGAAMRLNQVTLGTTDYEASCAFYETLGLRRIVATADGHYARFEAPGGATLSIHQGGQTVYFECDTLDAEVARLQSAGIVFAQLPTDQSWRWREARLSDPAGNAICLYQAGENRRYPPWRIV